MELLFHLLLGTGSGMIVKPKLRYKLACLDDIFLKPKQSHSGFLSFGGYKRSFKNRRLCEENII